MRGRVWLAGLAVAGSLATTGHAMEFWSVPGPQMNLIAARGEIVPGDSAKLNQFLAAQDGKPVALLLNSSGGNVLDAAAIAESIRRGRIPVIVGDGRTCASACFLIFAASPTRSVFRSSRIGVHSASRDSAETMDAMAMTTAMAREARQYGVPQAIIGRMVTTPPQQMAWLSEAELRTMNVIFLDESVPRTPAPPPPAPLVARPAPALPPIAGGPLPSTKPPAIAADTSGGQQATQPFGAKPTPTQPFGATAALPPSGGLMTTPPGTENGPSFQQGLADRTAWERWFEGLPPSVKAGAEYWSAQRSTPKPGGCASPDAAFMAGCTEAQRRLALSDAKRRSDPDYRLGWNSY